MLKHISIGGQRPPFPTVLLRLTSGSGPFPLLGQALCLKINHLQTQHDAFFKMDFNVFQCKRFKSVSHLTCVGINCGFLINRSKVPLHTYLPRLSEIQGCVQVLQNPLTPRMSAPAQTEPPQQGPGRRAPQKDARGWLQALERASELTEQMCHICQTSTT